MGLSFIVRGSILLQLSYHPVFTIVIFLLYSSTLSVLLSVTTDIHADTLLPTPRNPPTSRRRGGEKRTSWSRHHSPTNTPEMDAADELLARRGQALIATSVTSTVLAIGTCGVRFMARRHAKGGLWWDDYSVIVAMVRPPSLLSLPALTPPGNGLRGPHLRLHRSNLRHEPDPRPPVHVPRPPLAHAGHHPRQDLRLLLLPAHPRPPPSLERLPRRAGPAPRRR